MQLASKIELTEAQIKELILAHLKANNKHGLKFGAITFDIYSGSTGYRDDVYEAPRLNRAVVSVELSLND